MTEFRVAYQYDADLVSYETGVDGFGDTLTQQAPAAETDINEIVRRFGITGSLPQGIRVPSYDDYGDTVFDFQSAQAVLLDARDSFMRLPPDVRQRFANDPQEFLEFCSDRSNLDEMRKMGLAVPAPVLDDQVKPVDAKPKA